MLKLSIRRLKPLRYWKSFARSFSVTQIHKTTDYTIDDYWLDTDNQQVHISYQESGIARKARYPYIWLQDNCQSPESFHPVLHARQTPLNSLNPNMRPVDIKLIDDRARMEIRWENERTSQYTIKFLHERRFPNDREEQDESIFSETNKELGTIRCWGSEMSSNIRYYDYEEVIKDDRTLMSWIQSLYCDGLTIIKDSPIVEKGYDWEKLPLRVLCKRISFARKVNFGEVFEIYNYPEAQNVAYTNGRLGLHTDIPAYKNSPEIQLLHCIRQASRGGSNYMTDGFKVAEYVKKEHPEIFDILVRTPVHFREYGHDPTVGFYDLESQHNILQVDPVTRKIEKVIYSQHQRASQMDIPLERVQKVYNALMHWDSLLYDERFMIKLRLNNNDIMCFNNLRVLHGREEFVVEGGDQRWFQGTYLEWDEVRSRFRASRKVYGQDWNDVV